jgi:3-isopropylmalate/(R)-2-methylmalate dehydratase small subunit
MKTFGGPVLFLDRSDINTDEIIPAKYLNEITKEDLKPYILEDLKLPGFDPNGPKTKNARVIVSRANFGCGSSREHAPWVFEVNGITAVIAESFARIFRQNMFNCGMAAIELPKTDLDLIFSHAGDDDATMSIDIEAGTLTMCGGGKKKIINFEISPFDKALVLAGGWVDYADQKYLSSKSMKTKKPRKGAFLFSANL